jgi:hypothetical protein
VILLVGLAAIGLAVLYWSPWSRRGIQAMARETGRTKWLKRPDR